jgi:hypothetical protein
LQIHFDTAAALAQFVGTLPTFIAVILAWMNSNGRISDVNSRIGDVNGRIGDTKSDIDKRIDDIRDLIRAEGAATRAELRAELRRVEEVMDARLKHLEEREH